MVKYNDITNNFIADKWINMVKFNLSNDIWKVNWSAWHKPGTKTKVSPKRNQTNDIPNTEPENSLGAQNAKSNLLL